MSFSFRLTSRRGNGRPLIVGAVLVVGIAAVFLLTRNRGGQAAQEGGAVRTGR